MNVSTSPAVWSQNDAPGQPGQAQTRITFYDHEVPNEFRSNAEGRPIFETKTYIRKTTPGDRLVIIERKASKEDFMRWPVEYKQYTSGNTMAIEGTPLEAWAQIARSQVMEFKALNIFTVEQFAVLPDAFGHNIMGFQGLRQKAQSFLMAAKGQSEFDNLQTELKKRDDEISRMKENEGAAAELMRSMQARLEALEAAPAPEQRQTLELPKGRQAVKAMI